MSPIDILNKIKELDRRFQNICDSAEVRCFSMPMEKKLDELVEEARAYVTDLKARAAAGILKRQLDKLEKKQ